MRSRSLSLSVVKRGQSRENAQHAPQDWQRPISAGGVDGLRHVGSSEAVAGGRLDLYHATNRTQWIGGR